MGSLFLLLRIEVADPMSDTLHSESMATSLFCRIGYHKFGSWEDRTVDTGNNESAKSPKHEIRRARFCQRCRLEQTDYSPQVGMLITPPDQN